MITFLIIYIVSLVFNSFAFRSLLSTEFGLFVITCPVLNTILAVWCSIDLLIARGKK